MADIRLSLDELTQNDTVDSCVPDLQQSTITNDVSTQSSNNTAIEDETQELEEALKDAVDLVINAFMKNDKLSQSVSSIPGFDRHSLVGKVEILLKVSKLLKNYEKVEATMKSLQDRLSKSKSQITRLESSKEDLMAKLEHLSQSVKVEDMISEVRQILKHTGVAAGPLFRVRCEDAEADDQEQAMEIVDETNRSEDINPDDILYNIVQHQEVAIDENVIFDDAEVEFADYVKNDDDLDVEKFKPSQEGTDNMKTDGTTKGNSLKGNGDNGVRHHKCEVCGKMFERWSVLRDHMRLHTGEKPFVCDICGKQFRLQIYLTNHKRSHTGEKPFACPDCGKTFSKSCNLNEHKKSHNKPLQCEHCPYKSASKRTLNRHLRTHTGEKPFACDYCGQKLSSKIRLKEHLAIHFQDRRYQCKLCSKSYTQKYALTYHVKKEHETLRPFECRKCKDVFVRQADLNAHMKKHDANYYISQTCKICGKVLCNEDSYRHHMAIHAPEKTVPCDQCDMMFYTIKSRRDHLKRVHEGRVYQCEVCGRKLVSSKGLKNHMMIHTGEKPFGCEVCGMYFRKLDTLKSHAKTHGSQAKYHCGLCGEKFISQSQFGGHRAKCDSTIFVMDEADELEDGDSNKT